MLQRDAHRGGDEPPTTTGSSRKWTELLRKLWTV